MLGHQRQYVGQQDAVAAEQPQSLFAGLRLVRVTHVGAYLVGWQRIDPQQVRHCDLKRELRG